MVRTLMDDGFERIWEETPVAQSQYYDVICLERLKKPQKNLSHDSRPEHFPRVASTPACSLVSNWDMRTNGRIVDSGLCRFRVQYLMKHIYTLSECIWSATVDRVVIC
jgi:hypothetical protein